MRIGDTVELEIDDMTAAGQGIGHSDGLAVFVDRAVVGDRVQVEVTRVKKRYAIGRVLSLLTPSSSRRTPLCPQADVCGGCPYGALHYPAQLALKERQVREKLVRIGGLTDPKMRSILGMDAPLQYRNKAAMAIWAGGLLTRKGGVTENLGEPTVGFFAGKSHHVLDCRECLLQTPPAMAAAEVVRRFMASDHITAYDPKWDKGLLRHLVVRTAFATGDVMVILVINGKGIPAAEKLIGQLDDAIFDLPVETDGPLAGIDWSLESVVLNCNRGKNGSLPGSIFGETGKVIAGRPTIREEIICLPTDCDSATDEGMVQEENLCPPPAEASQQIAATGSESDSLRLQFEVSPMSFYQVNPRQTGRLYSQALAYANLQGGETVLDLYCGVGTIGLFAAAAMNRKAQQAAEMNGKAPQATEMNCKASPTAEINHTVQQTAEVNRMTRSPMPSNGDAICSGRVIGIESVPAAVLDANRNAVINGIVNARYLCGKAEEELPRLLRGEGAAAEDPGLQVTHADVVFMDPPRAGCDTALLEAVAAARSDRIVYVSCDPATLARDIRILAQLGYRFREATPVDMFPWTGAIECVALLSRKDT